MNANAMPFRDWYALSSNPLVPLSIGGHRVTQDGVDAAHMLSRQTWKGNEDFRRTINRDEFHKMSFVAIAETLSNAPTHLPPGDPVDGKTITVDTNFFSVLAKEYIDQLNNLANRRRSDLYWHVPCHLFDRDQKVAAFSVGSVEFSPRTDWIRRFVTDEGERSYIDQVEAGTLEMDEVRRLALAPSHRRGQLDAWHVLRFLQGFSWVSTVEIRGHELARSHDKASVLVGLAIDAIGSRFHIDDARRFAKAGREHPFAEVRLATDTGGAVVTTSSVQIPGLRGGPRSLAAKMTAERPFLNAAGLLLDVYKEGRQTGRAPRLIERWANALYWFGEARREPSDFMAVVKYGCAADTLSGAGGNSKEMIEFAEAALNPKGNPTNSSSISDAITRLYSQGRNKIAHGEEPGLLEDLTETRAIGDALLSGLFDSVTPALAEIQASKPNILTLKEGQAIRAFKERLEQRS